MQSLDLVVNKPCFSGGSLDHVFGDGSGRSSAVDGPVKRCVTLPFLWWRLRPLQPEINISWGGGHARPRGGTVSRGRGTVKIANLAVRQWQFPTVSSVPLSWVRFLINATAPR